MSMRIFAFVLVTSALLAAPVVAQSVYGGPAEVVDGDTIRMEGERLRLLAIDSCEEGQPATKDGVTFDCGTWASDALRAMLRGTTVRCVAERRDYYGRPLVDCTADGRDIGVMLLRSGVAFAYEPRDLNGTQRAAWAAAQTERIGVYGFDAVEHPRQWRRR